MRKLITGLAIAAGLAVPSTASASYTQCPDRSYGSGTGNITTRHASCRDAYRLIARLHDGKGDGSYRCKTTDAGYEQYEVRCTASRGRVVHWFGWA
jgi:Ni,Fe-hydrogenase III large subunit